MLPVEYHPNAREDMRRLVRKNARIAGIVAAVLQQMKADPDLHESLLVHDATENNVNIKKWWAPYKKGKDLWRLKIWEPEDGPLVNYRVVYSFIRHSHGKPRFCVLAVVHRGEFNYEPDSEIGQRIIQDYEALL